MFWLRTQTTSPIIGKFVYIFSAKLGFMTPKKILVLATALALVGTALYFRLRPAAEVAKGPGDMAVTATVAQVRDVPVRIDVNGSVTSLKTVEVRAQTSNLVQKVMVKEGQFVQQGTVLFQLDDRADRANLEKLRAQLERDRALLADLERQYRRSQELKKQNFVAQSATDTAASQRDAQQAAVKSDEAAVAAAEVTLDYDTIRAPLSGRLGLINVFPGSLVQPTTTVLTTVTQLDPISVQFNVPESSLPFLQAALSSQAHDNVRARVPAGGADVTGSLYFVDNLVDTSTGTIKAKATFSNGKSLLWPGQYVQTRIDLSTLKNAVVMPASALVTSISGRFVYVIQKDSTVAPKPVVVRHVFGEMMAVEGLSGGEQIVTDGKQNLRPGTKVRVVGEGGTKP